MDDRIRYRIEKSPDILRALWHLYKTLTTQLGTVEQWGDDPDYPEISEARHLLSKSTVCYCQQLGSECDFCSGKRTLGDEDTFVSLMKKIEATGTR